MASSEELRINKNQHKPKQKSTDREEINKLKSQMKKIKSFLEKKLKYKFE